MLLIDFFLANTILVAVLVGLVFIFHALLPDPGRCKIVEAQLPLVTVIIPARNDENKIGACVQSLIDQDYPAFEVVVIDDRSADGTGRIVKELAGRDSMIKYVAKTEPPPSGWTGKCSALKEAVEHAGGDWLFFVDADTRHQPGSIRSALSFALENKAHMVSFWPPGERRFHQRGLSVLCLAGISPRRGYVARADLYGRPSTAPGQPVDTPRIQEDDDLPRAATDVKRVPTIGLLTNCLNSTNNGVYLNQIVPAPPFFNVVTYQPSPG